MKRSGSTIAQKVSAPFCLGVSLLLGTSGCAPTLIPLRYAPSSSHHSELGHGSALRLQVIDARTITNRFGQMPLAPERPLAEIVEQGFRVALSRVNYILSDNSNVGYQVKIEQFDVAWGSQILSTPIHSTVSLQITVLKDGRAIGSRAVGQTREAVARFHNDILGRTSETLSAAMSEAIYQAVHDTTLNFLLRRPEGLTNVADVEVPSAPLTPGQEQKVLDPEPASVVLTGVEAELEERHWNQTLLKNTTEAYLEYAKKYTNTGRVKVLTGTLTAEMGMQFSFGARNDGPNVKKIILSMGQYPSFRQEVSVEDATRWKIIDHKPVASGVAALDMRPRTYPNATVILLKKSREILAIDKGLQ